MDVYIKTGKRLTFSEYLHIISYIYSKSIDAVKDYVKKMEQQLISGKVTKINYSDNRYNGYYYGNNYIFEITDLKTGKQQTIEFSESIYNGEFITNGKVNSIAFKYVHSLFNILKNIKLCGKVNLEGQNFESIVVMNMHEFTIDLEEEAIDVLLEINIRSDNSLNTFYYDFKSKQLGVVKNNQFFALSSNIAEKLMSALDFYEQYDFDLSEVKLPLAYIDKKGKIYSSNGGWFPREEYYHLSFLDEEKPKEEVDFLKSLLGTNESIDFTTNSENIRNSLKMTLMALKKSKTVLPMYQKIKLRDSIFFKEITSEKKIIDEFFKDPEILSNCNLEHIDFTNADIRGFNFCGSNAQIILQKVYERSIEGTGLKGINLSFQTLDGIVADNADLRDTYITVHIGDTSIVGTKFSDTSSFYLNSVLLSKEMLQKMDISIEKSKEQEIQLSLIRTKYVLERNESL